MGNKPHGYVSPPYNTHPANHYGIPQLKNTTHDTPYRLREGQVPPCNKNYKSGTSGLKPMQNLKLPGCKTPWAYLCSNVIELLRF
jgi:hypothetical protein